MASGPGLPNTGSPVQLIYIIMGVLSLIVGSIMTKIGYGNNDNDNGVGPYSVD